MVQEQGENQLLDDTSEHDFSLPYLTLLRSEISCSKLVVSKGGDEI